MNYNIKTIVETEDGDILFHSETTAGFSDFEENVVRKIEHSIKKYEAEQEYRMQQEIDDQKENEAYDSMVDNSL